MENTDTRPCVLAFTGHRTNRLPWHAGLTLPGKIRRAMKHWAKACCPGVAGTTPTLVTGLSEGADQIAAEAALRLGWHLDVVLPLPPKDFGAGLSRLRDRNRFDRLVAQAGNVDIVAGDPSAPWLPAGLAILDKARALLAVHDGNGSAGPGGTADLIARAREKGLEVRVIRV